MRAALYVLVWQGPTLFAYAQEEYANYCRRMNPNTPIIDKYKKIFNLSDYDPYQDDDKLFHIHKNVDRLGQERVRIYGDTHDNRTCQDLVSLSMAAQSQPGDALLIENVGARRIVNCSQYSSQVKDRDPNFPGKSVAFRAEYPHTVDLCVGSDSINSHNDFVNAMDRIEATNVYIFDGLKKVSSKLIDAEQLIRSQLPTLPDAKDLETAAEKFNKDCHAIINEYRANDLEEYINDFLKWYKKEMCNMCARSIRERFTEDDFYYRYGDFLVLSQHKLMDYGSDEVEDRSRNRILIDSLKWLMTKLVELKRSDAVIYIIWGKSHFVPERLLESNSMFAEVTPDDSQFQIRQFLEKSGIKYSIRVPR